MWSDRIGYQFIFCNHNIEYGTAVGILKLLFWNKHANGAAVTLEAAHIAIWQDVEVITG